MGEGVSRPDWEQIRSLTVSARVDAVHRRFLARYQERGAHFFYEEDAARARDEAILDAYRGTAGLAPILRRARALTEFAERIPIALAPDDLLVGSQTFNRPGFPAAVDAELRDLGYARTTGHIIHDYEAILRLGITGLRRNLARASAEAGSPEASVNLAAFDEALDAFRRYVERHADEAARLARSLSGDAAAEWQARAADLRALTGFPPANFSQALQLVWLVQTFLHAENPSAAISFGRIDQYLWPFLHADLAEGRLTTEDAFALVCAFCIKCCEGEESQNATLGGVDAQGDDASNPLSLLFLAAVRALSTFQPSLMVRVHPGASAEFLRAACELAAAGAGHPGFMNDAPAVAGLQALGIPAERAGDWGVVGCYEASPQGDTYPNTVLGKLHLAEVFAAYLATPDAQSSLTFDELLDGFYAAVTAHYHNQTLTACQAAWNRMRDAAPSPFGSLLLRDCLRRALPLEAGGAAFSLVGINILGLGTLLDSLHAIRTFVFERRETTVAAIAEAVSADFPEEMLRQRLRHCPGRYGTDAAATNDLAREVSDTLARMVLESRLEGGVRPYPGFFAFGADIHDLRTASPDGRRQAEFLSYGVAPATAVETSQTAALTSASRVAHALAACGSPFALTLPGMTGPAGADLIREIVQAYFALGGSHLHINTADAATLRQAQRNPEAYAHLTVRVSGYSARFVHLDPRWQEALIQRAERGM